MADSKELIKGWIQFLKNNGIANVKSDPTTGQLSYRRKVTRSDIARYLELSHIPTETATAAIDRVLGAKAPAAGPPASAGTTPPAPGPTGTTADSSDGSATSDSDAVGVNNKQKPRVKYVPPASSTGPSAKPRVKFVKEAIVDEPEATLDEDDIEEIFKSIATQDAESKEAASKEKKSADLAKIKMIIHKTMTEQQRTALWRLLNDA